MNDYSDWLGHAAQDLTDDQRDAFERLANDYYQLPFHSDRDPEDYLAHSGEDDAALTAALQRVLREDSLMGAASRAHQAQLELEAWIRIEAAAGTPEREIEEHARISRMTVRKRLGR